MSRRTCSPLKAVDIWSSLKVPPIECWRPDPRKHPAVSAWVRKEDHDLYWNLSNPQRLTAYHLAVVLPAKPPNVLVAYCLWAFAKENLSGGRASYDLFHSFLNETILPLFEENGEDLHWWHSNARKVMPPYDSQGEFERMMEWDEKRPTGNAVVEEVARAWTAAANQSLVVWLPNWDRAAQDWRDRATR